MMDAVESGAVKTVVTKDLSRLGRNYLQVGLFTEIGYPWGIQAEKVELSININKIG